MEKFKPKRGFLLIQFILLIAAVFFMAWIKDKAVSPKQKIKAPAINHEPEEYISVEQLENPKIEAKDILFHPIPMPEFENYEPEATALAE